MKRAYLKVIAGILISLLLVYFILYKPRLGLMFGNGSAFDAFFGEPRLNLGHLIEQVLAVRLMPLAICFLINPIHILIRSHRWVKMIEPISHIRLRDSFSIQHVGYFANITLPLRMGEVLKAVLIGNHASIPRSSALATVVEERMLDGLSLLLLIAIIAIVNALYFNTVQGIGRRIGPAVLGIGLSALLLTVIVVILAFSRDPLGGVLGQIIRLLPKKIGAKVHLLADQFLAGLAMLRTGHKYAVIFTETAILWLMYGLQIYFALLAFGFNTSVPIIEATPLFASFIILLFGAVGLSVPSAPAGVGTFHAAVILALSLLGVSDSDIAAGFAVVLHAVTTIYYLAVGMFFLWREGMHIGELKRIAPRSRSEVLP